MIVPMKKVTVITLDKDADSTVAFLRKLGVVHVEHAQKPQGEDINKIQSDIDLVNSCLDVLSAKGLYAESMACLDKELADWRFTARHIVDLRKRLEQLEEYSATLAARIPQLEDWGDFNPQALDELSRKNIFIRFYQIPLKELRLAPEGVVVKKISSSGSVANCALVSIGRVEIPFKEIALPKISLGELRKRQAEDRQAAHTIKDELAKLVCHHKRFSAVKNSLQRELEFHQAIKGMGRSGSITYLAGYVPSDRVEEVILQAKSRKWGVHVSDPKEEDDVPVLIRNPRWISLISPIFKFLEILPGYRELDISPLFLIFFSIFFGILIGDAGYGMIYAIITYLLQKRAKKKGMDTSSFSLFYILSLCAIMWGALTGIFFGQEWVLKAGYKPLLPALNDEKVIQRFCFFLGALHLSIAHGWRGLLKLPSIAALADFGWLCVLWAAFFIAKTLILGDGFPSFCIWLVMLGAALVIFSTSPRKNVLKSAEEWMSWLITLPFSFIGNFADVVSYIRLFAVGLAGVAIADAFNAMAAMVGSGSMLMIALAAFIALIGNTLGVILGPVSVLVHGVRLNLLEFSGHANISWSGSPYKPLKEEG